MDLISSATEMQQRALALRAAGRRIALVPTMGYLHEGHLSLVRLARKRADVVILSLFVNPTQFGPNEDFSRYPRDFERDRALCEKAGVDLLFAPEKESMYVADASVRVTEECLSRGLCGASRPGHFSGVTTVVAKLFNLCQPHVAVFGEKDAQQIRVIRRMVRDLDFPVEIVGAPIVREPDGLAMSSRNVLLKPEHRRQAVCLRRALDVAKRLVALSERNPDGLRAAMEAEIAVAPDAVIDYIAIVDDYSLEPVVRVKRPVLVALAVKFGNVRLIDNEVLKP
jgi:pantoate--beta-alanine ligase